MHQQRGAVALIVTTLLVFAMVLATLFAQRNLVFEQHASANQYRATQAFEAAEAGAQWALAQLANPKRLGPDCEPTSDATATSFRSRYLKQASTTVIPSTWNTGSATAPLQPTCVRSSAGWTCSCPASSPPVLSVPAGEGTFPAFSLQFMASDSAGSVRVVSTGCTRLAGACFVGSAHNADAIARVEVTVSLLAGLRMPPAAALTTRGGIDANSAPFGAHNGDTATGIAIHTGSDFAAGRARLSGAAGAPLSNALLSNDATLASPSADRFFAAWFGLDKERWKNQPAVQRIVCASDCGATIKAAGAAVDDSALLWVEGDLALDGPVTLGSPEHPILLVVTGAARLRGAVTFHGLLYAASLQWDGALAPGAVLRGAAVSEAGYSGNGSPDFVYDRHALELLQTRSGTFTLVNGSWRDF